MLVLYFQLCLITVTGSLNKRREVDQTIPQSQMGNVFKIIWQNSANSMASANGMGNQLKTNCFGMSGLNPMQPQIGQNNFIVCPCVQEITYDRNGCAVCTCLDKIAKSSTSTTISTSSKLRTTLPDKRKTPHFVNAISDVTTHHLRTETPSTQSVDAPIVTWSIKSTSVLSSLGVGTYKSMMNSQQNTSKTYKSVDQQINQHMNMSKMTTSVSPGRNKLDQSFNRLLISSIVEEKSFTISVALGVALLFVSTVAVVFICLWRRTSRLLRRERDELYFTEKSFRNESMKSMEGSRSRNSILSVIGMQDSLPDLPLRTPPLTPTAPSILTSTPNDLTRVGQTSFKIPPDELKHDYLELM